jgi:hypothetical protein
VTAARDGKANADIFMQGRPAQQARHVDAEDRDIWAVNEQASQPMVLTPQFRLRFDVDSLAKADSETLYAALLRGRQGGWLSPDDCPRGNGLAGVERSDRRQRRAAGRRRQAGARRAVEAAPPAADNDQKVARLTVWR